MRRSSLFCIMIVWLSMITVTFGQHTDQPKVLIFSKTAGYRHASIPDGIAAIKQIGKEHGFMVDVTEDAALFRDDQIRQYAAIIFLSTTGNVLDSLQERAFMRYIKAGGGFVGVHAATDTEYDWPWYGQLVGGYFESHPETQQAVLNIKNANHLSTKELPQQWIRTDEWYNFKNLNPTVNMLLTIDEASYKGGKNGAHHPMSWFHKFDGGRAFYTALGHTKESYAEPLFLKHLAGGILSVIRGNQ